MASALIKLFLCGDVMTGRAIDQILPHPCSPPIHESYLKDARDYIELAERKNGGISRAVGFSYIWGDALKAFAHHRPDVKIINLETSVTTSDDWMPKGINYRMNPENLPCLKEAGIDCCVLANNHVLDYGPLGLEETLDSLTQAGIAFTGVGRNRAQAEAPVVIEVLGKARVSVFGFGMETAGVPRSWAAGDRSGGVAFLSDLSDKTIQQIADRVRTVKIEPCDIAIASIHWGDNWSFEVGRDQIEFAHKLIDEAKIDVVHAHSSHHPKAIEVYHEHLILYGCGDFINDYEGITGYEEFRPDLSLMYFVTIEPQTGKLVRLEMNATQMKRLRVTSASPDDARWLNDLLNREGKHFNTQFTVSGDHILELR